MDAVLTQTKTPGQNRIATTVFFFISGFAYAAWASRIPSIQRHLNLNEAELGAVLFAMPVGLMMTMPITNYLLHRFSSRSIMLVGAIGFNMMLCLLGLVTHTWQLVVVLFFFGSSRNLMNLSVNAQGVGVQALYDKSIITTFHGIWSLAGFAGAAVGFIAVATRIHMIWHLSAVALSMSILALFFYPSALQQKPAERQNRPGFSLPDKYMLKFALITFACMACENTMYDWSSIYFEKVVLTPKQTATSAFVFYMVAMTAGRFVGDWLVPRIGIKKMLKYSGILIGSGLFLAVIFPNIIVAGLGFVLTGLGVACIVPLVFSLAGRSKKISSAAAIASISSIGYLGFLIVPPFVGFVAQALGLRVSFGIIGLLGLLIVFLVSKIQEEE